MKINYLVNLILFVLIINSCEKNGNRRFYPVQEQQKKWAFFDTGSWWLYQEQISGELDSIYVKSSELIQYDSEENAKPKYTAQYINVNLSNSNKWFFSGTKGGSSISIDGSLGTELGRVYLVYKPLTIGSRKGPNGLGYSEITDIQNQYSFDSFYRDTCITVLNNRDDLHQHDTVEYKILRGLGVISKKVRKAKKEWKLIKYKIVLNSN